MTGNQAEWCNSVVKAYAEEVGLSFISALKVLNNTKAYRNAWTSVNLDEYLTEKMAELATHEKTFLSE